MISKEDDILIIEHWIQVLLTSYQYSPDKQINQYIIDYLNRLLTHDACFTELETICQYRKMQKYWLWKLHTTV